MNNGERRQTAIKINIPDQGNLELKASDSQHAVFRIILLAVAVSYYRQLALTDMKITVSDILPRRHFARRHQDTKTGRHTELHELRQGSRT